MAIQAPTPSPIDGWPAPKGYRRSDTSTGALPCAVELLDGRVLHGELAQLERGGKHVGLKLAKLQAPTRVDLATVRAVTLTQPMAYVPDVTGTEPVGPDAAPVDDRTTFTVTFADGAKKTGQALGVVRDPDRLFLFLTDGGTTLVSACIIPLGNVAEFQLRALEDRALVEAQSAVGDAASWALNTQTLRRREKARKSLSDRAIRSPVKLLRALREAQRRPNVPLGQLLLEAGVINPAQLDSALAVQATHRQRRLGEILTEMGVVSTRLIQSVLADKLGIPYVDASAFELDPGALDLVDTEFAIRRQVLPLVRTDRELIVAVEDPLSIDFVQELRLKAAMGIVAVIANPEELKSRIAREYSNRADASADGAHANGHGSRGDSARERSFADVQRANAADLASQLGRETQHAARPAIDQFADARVADNTLVKLVNKIIIEANALGASDIHIEASSGTNNTRIRFRRDGNLEDYLVLPQAYSSALVSRVKIMSDLDISEHRRPQDGKIDFGRYGPLSIELRVAVIPTTNGMEDVVMRILGGTEPLPLDHLGFSDPDLGRITAMIARSYGLILVCGPTGSGKTTTLHSLLRHINKPDIKIWTAEDPIEISQPGLRQVQVQPKIDWTFAAAMRAFLRADPDVIMVGEMRDDETAKIAIEASLTGHLVFSTLHTNSAAESIVRLLDLGMDPFNFADALIGIASQRLAQKLCPNCKQARVLADRELADLSAEYCRESPLDPADVLRRWRTELAQDGHVVVYQAVGCDLCRNGYKGRVVVYELLSGTADVKHLVRTRAPVPQLLAAAQEAGMVSLRQNATDKILRGVIDAASARAVSS